MASLKSLESRAGAVRQRLHDRREHIMAGVVLWQAYVRARLESSDNIPRAFIAGFLLDQSRTALKRLIPALSRVGRQALKWRGPLAGLITRLNFS